MDGYEVTSPAGPRTWASDSEDHAREQHTLAFPDEPILAVKLLDPWWILIARAYSNDLAVGPYPTQDVADLAFMSSLLIDGLCEEDCLDATVAQGSPDETFERVIIDDTDPHHFG